ncbi:MAG: hemerythrin domain-containing protein [Actinomycetota bacterium]|nr:hemerythrin domain-containing protein [Acidimicrobiia bacterium]MDQ3294679.1 hemerythrin domain-containing protein [Actinomycetota bacterium]
MNIISVLTTDHRNVDDLFKRFEKAAADDTAELGRVRDLILEQLAIHAEIEEQTLYPALREAATDDVLEALEEHHAVKAILAELEKMPPNAERFRAKMQVVIENVRHHVEEEEGDGGLFEVARQTLKTPELEAMAEQAEQLRKVGPTRPHPFASDQPPFNVILGLPMAVLDRAVSTARKVVEKTLLRKAS